MSLPSWAAQATVALAIEVVADSAPLLSAPDERSEVKGRVPSGRHLVALGPSQAGFYKVQSKSGLAVYVRQSDVRILGGDEDLVSPRRQNLPRPRVTYDLGASGGSVNGVSYFEAGLGINWFFASHFSWRNAVFGRFPQSEDAIYGLDTSLRAHADLPLTNFAAIASFAGPGFRFVSRGKAAPFAEAGLVFHLAGLNIGGGVKSVLNSWIERGAQNDTQYFLILAGGGSL